VASVDETVVTSWKQLRDILEDLADAGWAFRGQADAKWPLESSLARHLRTFVTPRRDRWNRESKILNTFQRKAHLLLPRTPDPSETLEWLALMQHHGAPTRLLDFTWSPYVAAFFALEQATNDAAIWALAPSDDVRNLRGFQISKMLREVLKLEQFQTQSRQNPTKFDGPETRQPEGAKDVDGRLQRAVIGEPVLMNQRMTAQAGTFVVPLTRIDVPLLDVVPSSRMFKVRLKTASLRRHTMDRLYNMNINNATLFPGIDGLARSLALELEFRWTVDLDAGKHLLKKLRAKKLRRRSGS
jgi:hypothetical protein